MEVTKEDKELLLVAAEDRFDLRRLLGVCNEDLENVEGLELDVAALVAEHVHHHLEIRLVSSLCFVVVPVGGLNV